LKIKNPNHPAKGSRITVEPIRRLADIKSIKKLITNNPRNHLLFVLGINNGLRVGDLLKLKINDVKKLKPGQSIVIRESKTGKNNILMINKTVYRALRIFLENAGPGDEEYLFASRKTKKPLTIQSVNALVKKWAREINLSGNYGLILCGKLSGISRGPSSGWGSRFWPSASIIPARLLPCGIWA